jgi:hypothetical protein
MVPQAPVSQSLVIYIVYPRTRRYEHTRGQFGVIYFLFVRVGVSLDVVQGRTVDHDTAVWLDGL